MQATSDILRRFYTDVWESGQLDRIDDYFDTSFSGPILVDDRAVELSEVREWMDILFALVRDIEVAFLHVLDVDDWASVFMRVTCTSHTTGRPVQVYQQIMSRQRNGRLIESYPQFDLLRFFEQLDQLPPDAYPLLMAGNRLT